MHCHIDISKMASLSVKRSIISKLLKVIFNFKMSSRLFVTRVVDKAKVIKRWYAKPARSDISIAELFSQLLL